MKFGDFLTYLITGLGAIGAWIVANKSLVPTIVGWFSAGKKDKLEVNDKQIAVEQKKFTLYESQIKFLNMQLDDLQEIITTKSTELTGVYQQLTKLRQRVKDLEMELITSEENRENFEKHCCLVEDCPNRIYCQSACDKVEEIEETLNEE